MKLGKCFPSFSFSLLEIDTQLGDDTIWEFHETFQECAGNNS